MNDILTSADVAEVLGVAPETVKTYVREGKLRAAQLGSVWVFTRQSLADDVTRLIEVESRPAPRASIVKPLRPALKGLL